MNGIEWEIPILILTFVTTPDKSYDTWMGGGPSASNILLDEFTYGEIIVDQRVGVWELHSFTYEIEWIQESIIRG